MRLKSLAVALAALLAVTVAAPSAASARSTAAGSPTTVGAPRVIASFPPGESGSFAESMVADQAGNLFVSVTTWTTAGWNRGQVWKITPSGTVRKFGPELKVGVLSGLAIDAHQQLYAGIVAWTDPALPKLLPGVVRVDARRATRVLTLPGGEYGQASFPNGLAFSDDVLYVSDSTRGSIWRTRPHGTVNDRQHTAWLTSPLLAPVTNFGVNGIAVDRTGIEAVNADKGSVVRIPVKPNGRPGQPALITQDARLVTADGVTLDGQHRLWVVTNSADGLGGSLLRVGPGCQVTTVAHNPGWLDYPTQPVFGTTPATHDSLFIANGAFNTGAPNVIALERRGRDH